MKKVVSPTLLKSIEKLQFLESLKEDQGKHGCHNTLQKIILATRYLGAYSIKCVKAREKEVNQSLLKWPSTLCSHLACNG